MVAVPRISRRRPGKVEARAAERELVGCQLAEQDRAGVGEHAHGRRIGVGDPLLQQLGMRGRGDAGGGVDVLVADRDAVERAAALALHHPRLGGSCIGQGALRREQDEAVQRAVEGRDPVQAMLRQFERRELPRRDPSRRFGDGEQLHQRGSGRKMSAGSASRPRPCARTRSSIGSTCSQVAYNPAACAGVSSNPARRTSALKSS